MKKIRNILFLFLALLLTGCGAKTPEKLVRSELEQIKKLDEKGLDAIHAQALKYKTLWTERYGLLPDGGGERYHGEQIV